MKNPFKLIFIIFLISGLFSCSLEKRVAKYIKAHPGYSITDTVWVWGEGMLQQTKANPDAINDAFKALDALSNGSGDQKPLNIPNKVFKEAVNQAKKQVTNYVNNKPCISDTTITYKGVSIFLHSEGGKLFVKWKVPVQVNNYKPEVKEVGWKWYWSVIGVLAALIGGVVISKLKF